MDCAVAEILLLSLLAGLAGAETFCDIARFGGKKLAFLRRFAPFAGGTPSHDRLGDIFATLDGKTSRRSYRKKGSKEPIHMVWAFAARQRLVPGQVKVDEKSNGIVAIPALLGMMAVEGAVAAIDAMGCQRDIATKIVEKKADYILALKGNQGLAAGAAQMAGVERRRHGQSNREIPGASPETGRTERETRFYITSCALKAEKPGPMIRDRWAIENSLHWVMDMTFRDGECRIRTEHAPANFTTLRHMAHNRFRKAPGKASLRLRRKTAAWDDDFLASLVAA